MNIEVVPRDWGRWLLKVAIFSAGVMGGMLLLWFAMGGRIPLPDVLGSLGYNFTYTMFIGGLSWLVIPRIHEYVACKAVALWWLLVLAALVGTAVVGTAGATVLLYYAFGGGHGLPLTDVYLDTLRTSIPITLIVGIVTTLIEAARHRLEDTQLALREQQLERERAEKLAAEAQLASLTSRVQPHFLFNTLNSISALIRTNPEQAERTLEQLSSLLRSSLDAQHTVTIGRELQLVNDYFEIQRTRFGARLRYEVDVSLDPHDATTVPPFAVQTLVENSLKHVGGQRLRGVSVQLRANREASDLVVAVTDDGPGFDLDAVKAGHGLENLRRRLLALYGDRAALDFRRKPAGMTVEIRVPAA